MRPPYNQPVLRAILVTDIVAHGKIRRELGNEGYRALKARHDAIVAGAARRRHGRVENDTGDGWVISFPTPTAAVLAALELQFRFCHEPDDPARLGVRMGIDMGEVVYGEYVPSPDETHNGTLISGEVIDIAALTMNLAHAQQVLVTGRVHEQSRRSVAEFPSCPPDEAVAKPVVVWHDHGIYPIKNRGRVPLFEVGGEGLGPFMAPLGGKRVRGSQVFGAADWKLQSLMSTWDYGETWLARSPTGELQVFLFADNESGRGALLRQVRIRRLLNERLEPQPAGQHSFLPVVDSRLEELPAFLRSEFLPDGNVRKAFAVGGAFAELGEGERIDFVRRVAEVLDRAHQGARVFHGSLDPSKVLVFQAEDGSPRPCLFGLGFEMPGTQTGLGLPPRSGDGNGNGNGNGTGGGDGDGEVSKFLGDDRYCPPEGLHRGVPSPAWDVYGLGVILYQVVTGRWEQLPIPGERHVKDPLLRREIFSCLEDDPGLRPAAAELATNLATLPHRRDVARYRRWLRRCAIWVIALAALIAVVVWVAINLREARALTELARASALSLRGEDVAVAHAVLENVPPRARGADWFALRAVAPVVRQFDQPGRLEEPPYIGGSRWAFLRPSAEQVFVTGRGIQLAAAGAGEVATPFRPAAVCFDPSRDLLWVAGGGGGQPGSAGVIAAFAAGEAGGWAPLSVEIEDGGAPVTAGGAAGDASEAPFPRVLEVEPGGRFLLVLWVGADQRGSLRVYSVDVSGSRAVLRPAVVRDGLPQPFYVPLDVNWQSGRVAFLDDLPPAEAADVGSASGEDAVRPRPAARVRVVEIGSGADVIEGSELGRFAVVPRSLMNLELSPAGEEMLLLELSQPVTRWTVPGGEKIGELFPLSGVEQSPGGEFVGQATYHPGFPEVPRVAVARREPEHQIEMWSVRDGHGWLEWSRDLHRSIVGHLRFSADGRRLASASVDQDHRVWQAGDGSLLLSANIPPKLSIEPPEFSADERMVSFGGSGAFHVWTLPAVRRETLTFAVNLVAPPFSDLSGEGVAFSADGSRMVVGLVGGGEVEFDLRRLLPAEREEGGGREVPAGGAGEPLREAELVRAGGAAALPGVENVRVTLMGDEPGDGSGGAGAFKMVFVGAGGEGERSAVAGADSIQNPGAGEFLNIPIGIPDGAPPPQRPGFVASPDGRWVVLLGWENHCRLLRVPALGAARLAAEILRSRASSYQGGVTVSERGWAAVVSEDGRRLAVRAPVAVGLRRPEILPAKIRQLLWLPSGELLLVVTEAGRASLWNPRFVVETVILAEHGCLGARIAPDDPECLQMMIRQPVKQMLPYQTPLPGVVERWELVEIDVPGPR